MSFPTSPVDGQIYQRYTYNGTTATWDKNEATIEYGSNDNGQWTKYSDGTLICYFKNTYQAGSNVSYYRTSWTYPMAFISSPTVTFTVNSSYQSGIDNASSYVTGDTSGVNGNPSATQVGMKIQKTSGYMASATVSHVAIGRWK